VDQRPAQWLGARLGARVSGIRPRPRPSRAVACGAVPAAASATLILTPLSAIPFRPPRELMPLDETLRTASRSTRCPQAEVVSTDLAEGLPFASLTGHGRTHVRFLPGSTPSFHLRWLRLFRQRSLPDMSGPAEASISAPASRWAAACSGRLGCGPLRGPGQASPAELQGTRSPTAGDAARRRSGEGSRHVAQGVGARPAGGGPCPSAVSTLGCPRSRGRPRPPARGERSRSAREGGPAGSCLAGAPLHTATTRCRGPDRRTAASESVRCIRRPGGVSPCGARCNSFPAGAGSGRHRDDGEHHCRGRGGSR